MEIAKIAEELSRYAEETNSKYILLAKTNIGVFTSIDAQIVDVFALVGGFLTDEGLLDDFIKISNCFKNGKPKGQVRQNLQ